MFGGNEELKLEEFDVAEDEVVKQTGGRRSRRGGRRSRRGGRRSRRGGRKSRRGGRRSRRGGRRSRRGGSLPKNVARRTKAKDGGKRKCPKYCRRKTVGCKGYKYRRHSRKSRRHARKALRHMRKSLRHSRRARRHP